MPEPEDTWVQNFEKLSDRVREDHLSFVSSQMSSDRAAAHRRKQIEILTNAMNEHAEELSENDMRQIGYAVFAAVGRIVVTGGGR